MSIQFPKNFLWGAATSSHQVEGGNRNDWSEWEKSESRIKNLESRIKSESFKKNFPAHIFDQWPTPLDVENYISGPACDHYNRYEEDFDIAKSLGHNAHRFSIEWSRIEPEEGKWDEREIEHYRKVIATLRTRGLEPFVTLWHWPVPLWLRDKGGVESKDFPEYFSRYAERMARELSDVNPVRSLARAKGASPWDLGEATSNGVKFWITLNEPEIYTVNSYSKGVWPPQKRRLTSSWRVFSNLAKAHNKAYGIIKNINPSAQVGIAKNNIYFEACENKLINRLLKKIVDWLWNFYFLNKIKDHQDFIGLNHYFHNRINYGFNKNANKKTSDLGWELYPEGIYNVLKDLKKYNKPVYITENGLADAQDKHREWYIKEILKNVSRAINEGVDPVRNSPPKPFGHESAGVISNGVDVRGYFYWSLLDNFEWDKGFWPRFGLVEVDYKTMERKIRPSAHEYTKIIKGNGF